MSHDYIDTRVTAYAFGELSAEQAAEFESELSQSSQLRTELAEIREAITALESEFQADSNEVGDTQREQIERAIAGRMVQRPEPPPPPISKEMSRERAYRRALMIASLAACVLVVVGLIIPYLRDRGQQNLALNDGNRVSEQIESGEFLVLVEDFNEAFEQERYGDAEAVAEQALELQPDAQVARMMMLSTQRGRRSLQERSGAEVAAPNDPPSAPGQVATVTDAGGDPAAEVFEVFEEFSLDSEDLALSAPPTEPTDAGESSRDITMMGGAGAAQESDSEMMLGMPMEATDMDMEMALEMEEFTDDLGTNSSDAFAGGGFAGGGFAGGLGDGGLGGAGGVRGGSRRRSNAMEMSMDEMLMEDMTIGGDMEGMMDEMSSGGMGMGMGGDDDMMLAAPGVRIAGSRMLGRGVVPERHSGDRFAQLTDNPFKPVSQAPLSTFSIDVDTASYAKVRSLLNQNTLPDPDAVRIEELVNYFDYDYPTPSDEHPFAVSMEVADCPWQPQHRLARIGIQGKVLEQDRPSSNLVFLLDVSGSMDEPNKLPLVIDGMKMLTDQLTENDRVAIVVYAGAAGMVLDSTRGDKRQIITAALDRLRAGGSTNGGQGVLLAYQIARDNFIVGGTNRVILCSDGDFNVGVTGTHELVELAKDQAKSNVFLSVLGFGTGNHNDQMMEQISNQANGNYAFVDSRNEARKVLVEEIGSTLVTIAKDVKIQVEFNPRKVAQYRLIGYENRVMAAADFDNDKKDAGEIGAGHTVTALYEIVPREADAADDSIGSSNDLRYQHPARLSEQAASDEVLILKMRYKQPEGDTSTLMEFPVTDSGKRFQQADRDFKFAAAVAGFGMMLRDSPYKGSATMSRIAEIATEAAKGDDFGYRTEFVELIKKARQLRGD